DLRYSAFDGSFGHNTRIICEVEVVPRSLLAVFARAAQVNGIYLLSDGSNLRSLLRFLRILRVAANRLAVAIARCAPECAVVAMAPRVAQVFPPYAILVEHFAQPRFILRYSPARFQVSAEHRINL